MKSIIVGFSDYTPEKEKHYTKLVEWHINLSMNVIRNHPERFYPSYLLIDATAGSGMVNGIVGSPLIAIDRLRKHTNWRAVLIEESRKVFKQLTCSIDQRYALRDQRIEMIGGSYVDYIERLKPDDRQIGLLYIDENGTPDFDAIRKFSKKMTKMEILVSVTATGWKRKNGCIKDESAPHLRDLAGLKTYTLIREPYGAQQWTFILGSNTFHFNKAYPKINLYPIDSEKGREYFDRADKTREELEELYQPALPELCGISETPDLPGNQSEGD